MHDWHSEHNPFFTVGLSKRTKEPCMAGGLVPGTSEIKGAVLGRLPYYVVRQ